jgi:hypothetical protein
VHRNGILGGTGPDFPYNEEMLRFARWAVLGLGLAAGPLLVRGLDQGFAGAPRDLGAGHVLLGVVVALAAQPGPLLGLFVTPASGEKARGLAVGGSAVTALCALFAGALLFRRAAWGLTEGVTLLWAASALPLAAVDFLRLRGGGYNSTP